MDPFFTSYDCTVTHNTDILRFIMNAPHSGHFIFQINVRTKVEQYYFCTDTNRWRLHRIVTDESSLESKRVVLRYNEVFDDDGSIRGALAQIGVPHPQHDRILTGIHTEAARLLAVAQQRPHNGRVRSIPILVDIGRVHLQTIPKPPNESNVVDNVGPVVGDDPEGAGESEDEMASLMSPSEDEDDEDFELIPASKASIEALEKVVMVGEKRNCSICLEEMEMNSEVTRMPCAHRFHGSCIVEWLEKRNVCPLCRYKMPSADDVEDDYDNDSDA